MPRGQHVGQFIMSPVARALHSDGRELEHQETLGGNLPKTVNDEVKTKKP